MKSNWFNLLITSFVFLGTAATPLGPTFRSRTSPIPRVPFPTPYTVTGAGKQFARLKVMPN